MFMKYLIILIFFTSSVLFPNDYMALAESVTKPPIPAMFALSKAQNLLQKDDVAGAIMVLSSFQSKAPKTWKPGHRDSKGYHHPGVNLVLGNCYLQIKDYKKAISFYRESLMCAPDYLQPRLNLANCYYNIKQYDKSGNEFLLGYKISKDKDPSLLYYAGLSYLTGNNNKKALETLERLVSIPDLILRLEWKEAVAHVYLLCDFPSRAIYWMEQIVKDAHGKRKKQWQELLLHQYINLGMKEKALSYARELIRDDPVEPEWWKGLAHIFLLENRYKEALIPLIIYSYIIVPSEEEKKLIADLHMAVGIPIKAVPIYKDIASVKQTPDIFERLAYAYIRSYSIPEAIEAVDNAIKNCQADKAGKFWMLKGRLLLNQEKERESIKAFKSAAKSGKNKGMAYMMAAYACLNLEDYIEARKYLVMAGKYPEQKEKARNILKRLKGI